MILSRYIRKSISLLIFIIAFGGLSAQNPYELNLKKDLALLGVGALGQATSVFLLSDIDPLTDEEIGLLNPNDINRFDRKATGYYSLRLQDRSDIFLNGAYAFPLLFLIKEEGRKGFFEIGVMTIESFLLNASVTTLTKVTVQRVRPLSYNPNVPLVKRKGETNKLSFFSGHTSAVSMLSFFSAKVFSDYYPESKWKPAVWSVAAILPAATAYLRVKGGKHFPTDVIVGYAVGAIIGIGVPHIHKKKDKDQRVGFSVLAGARSVGLTMSW